MRGVIFDFDDTVRGCSILEDIVLFVVRLLVECFSIDVNIVGVSSGWRFARLRVRRRRGHHLQLIIARSTSRKADGSDHAMGERYMLQAEVRRGWKVLSCRVFWMNVSSCRRRCTS